MMIMQQRGMSIERLLDDASTVDCAIRLRQPAWAAAIAARLAADLAHHEQEMVETCRALGDPAGSALAQELRALRAPLSGLADELRRGGQWPHADVYRRVESLIRHEAVSVGDVAPGLVD